MLCYVMLGVFQTASIGYVYNTFLTITRQANVLDHFGQKNF